MNKLRLAILGFGNVGQAFAELIEKNHQKILENYETDVQVVAIATRSKGNLVDEKGLNLKEVLEEIKEKGSLRDNSASAEKDNLDIIRCVNFDILVELTPLNVQDGEPAITHIKEAFALNKGVITANKGPVAWAYEQLEKLAYKAHVPFLYESTVMDGTPVFNMYRNCLKMSEVSEISGVLNTTTNFLLGRLEEGVSFEAALEEGRKMGFVEADPHLDIDGWDSAVKITVLAKVLMKARITPDQVDRQGITGITAEELKAVRREGNTIKLMCRAHKSEDGKVVARVAPEIISLSDKMALVKGTTSAVSITTDMMGELTIFENNPDIYQTAYGVFSDMLSLIKNYHD